MMTPNHLQKNLGQCGPFETPLTVKTRQNLGLNNFLENNEYKRNYKDYFQYPRLVRDIKYRWVQIQPNFLSNTLDILLISLFAASSRKRGHR